MLVFAQEVEVVAEWERRTSGTVPEIGKSIVFLVGRSSPIRPQLRCLFVYLFVFLVYIRDEE